MLKGRCPFTGDVVGKKKAYGGNQDIIRKKKKAYLKSRILASKHQGLNLLTSHYIVSPNRELMN